MSSHDRTGVPCFRIYDMMDKSSETIKVSMRGSVVPSLRQVCQCTRTDVARWRSHPATLVVKGLMPFLRVTMQGALLVLQEAPPK